MKALEIRNTAIFFLVLAVIINIAYKFSSSLALPKEYLGATATFTAIFILLTIKTIRNAISEATWSYGKRVIDPVFKVVIGLFVLLSLTGLFTIGKLL